MAKRENVLRKAADLLRDPSLRTLAVDVRSLLALPLLREDDLFALMEPDVRRIAQLPPMDFAALRRKARGRTLEEKYDDLSSRLIGINVRALAQVERRYRMNLPHLLPEVNALLRLARRLGKRLIVYEPGSPVLTNEDVRQVLAALGAETPDDICIDHWNQDVVGANTLTISPEKEPRGHHHLLLPGPLGERLLRDAPREAANFLGFRAMRAMAELHPSVPDATPQAYGAFGMHLFSTAMWLVDECCRSGFDRVNFLARDGYLVKQAFDLVRDALKLPIETGYVRISRQAVFPLHFGKPNDLLALPLLTDLHAHTPKTLLDLFAPVVDQAEAVPVLREWGFIPNKPLDDEEIDRFIEVFRTRLFRQERFDQYLVWAKAYLAPLFTGRCATFDVGYNLRSEQVIAEATGCSLTAFVIHTDSDLANRRGVEFRPMLHATPAVSWVVREQFLLEDGPACTGYDEEGPVLADTWTHNCEAIRRYQQEALAFVQDMTGFFGEDLARLHFRPADGIAPFERFMQHASRGEISRFRTSEVENAFLDGVNQPDDVCLQWRLMQTDAWPLPDCVRKPVRALIRLTHDPKGFARRAAGRISGKKYRG